MCSSHNFGDAVEVRPFFLNFALNDQFTANERPLATEDGNPSGCCLQGQLCDVRLWFVRSRNLIGIDIIICESRHDVMVAIHTAVVLYTNLLISDFSQLCGPLAVLVLFRGLR